MINYEAILREFLRLYEDERADHMSLPEGDLSDDAMEYRLFWETVDGALKELEREHVGQYMTQAELIGDLAARVVVLEANVDIFRRERHARALEMAMGSENED